MNISRTDSATLKHSDIIDLKSLNVAFLNLKKNCCANKEFHNSNIENCEIDKQYFQDNHDKVPQSYSLFDHAFDVLMRRLDGETGENQLYKDVTPDPKGEEWRVRINEKAEDLSGVAPSTINNKYQEFWNVDPNNLLKGFSQDSSRSIREYITEMRSGENLEILQRYNELTLEEKYLNTCNIAGYIYFLFNIDEQLTTITETRSNFLNSNRCTNLVKNRIENETTYVKVINITRSNDLQNDKISEYLTYLYQRLQKKLETVEKIATTFERVERSVPKLTPICS